MTLFPLLAGMFGLLAGSFANVCILRIPAGESVVLPSSRCNNCGRRLRWFELIPVLSYLFLRGRCARCGARISLQYPLIELSCALLWALCALVCGVEDWLSALFGCLLLTALLIVAVIDGRTGEIPLGLSVFIAALGAARLVFEPDLWFNALAGAVAVSVPLLVIYIITGGAGIGGGDIKLMAAAGLLLGWQNILAAFFGGCLFGSVIHLFRMRVSGAGRSLALGPYLAAGIFIAYLWGSSLVSFLFA